MEKCYHLTYTDEHGQEKTQDFCVDICAALSYVDVQSKGYHLKRSGNSNILLSYSEDYKILWGEDL
tara:strand:- start:1660 stop:1857 length:198 start_codon:yes stop_codon:yes gene_type:complete